MWTWKVTVEAIFVMRSPLPPKASTRLKAWEGSGSYYCMHLFCAHCTPSYLQPLANLLPVYLVYCVHIALWLFTATSKLTTSLLSHPYVALGFGRERYEFHFSVKQILQVPIYFYHHHLKHQADPPLVTTRRIPFLES